MDGYGKCDNSVIDQIGTEAFLRGCRDKDFARHVIEEPRNDQQGVKTIENLNRQPEGNTSIRIQKSPDQYTRGRSPDQYTREDHLSNIIAVDHQIGIHPSLIPIDQQHLNQARDQNGQHLHGQTPEIPVISGNGHLHQDTEQIKAQPQQRSL
ncbi:unnamed protein product [Mytilus coruscus]|uniref:Uncharacterized protein n=1 Tax=Mytilus coruscus TaxID=42192 RepID=A0A6J8DIK0_MYTCO|nr:unnamed protein product [Mytilus coruscus]